MDRHPWYGEHQHYHGIQVQYEFQLCYKGCHHYQLGQGTDDGNDQLDYFKKVVDATSMLGAVVVAMLE